MKAMRLISLSYLLVLIVATAGCSSIGSAFKPSPHTAPSYADADLDTGSLAVVLQQGDLSIGGNASDSFDLEGIDAFAPFFLDSFGDSLMTYGLFSSVESRREDAPIAVKQGTYRVASNKYEVFDAPAEGVSFTLSGGEADYVMLISELNVSASKAFPHPNPSMGMSPPTAWASIDYVLWHNRDKEVVSYGRFRDYIVADPGFDRPELWQKLAGHLAWLTTRKTPFEQSISS